jgi:uncharacterized lipoprotein YddW (UPF0748 family)
LNNKRAHGSSRWLAIVAALTSLGCAARGHAQPAPEVRGTWLTTTANDHIASPAHTERTMQRLRAIGLNTVYVEAWKNGYTQFPSQTLHRLIGLDRRPDLAKQDPADPDRPTPARDLLQETLIEAHRHSLLYIAWFEYGFMAAHQSTMNHLRSVKPDWISRNRAGDEVAPNGFVWLNPLHPQARRFLLDLVLEAVDRYDLDGVQLDDRIVWPHVTMGYDDYTRAVYANEHGGAQPPDDHADPDWIAWRSAKIDEYARQFVAEVRAARPGLIVSVSPAPYPWVYDNYCLNWIDWAAKGMWDEYIPQCYRYDFEAFKGTWDQQVGYLSEAGADVSDMLAGILTTGSQPEPVPWDDLRRSVEHVRATGGGGHVWWFSRGVLDEYPAEIAAFYDAKSRGHAEHPRRPDGWRAESIPFTRSSAGVWSGNDLPVGAYRVIAKRGGVWSYAQDLAVTSRGARVDLQMDNDQAGNNGIEAVEVLVDRRPEMNAGRPAGRGGSR